MSIGIKSPLSRSDSEGFFTSTNTTLEVAQSNARNLLLTVPGERLMHPKMGLSPKKELFENNFNQEVYKDKVYSQFEKYLSYVTVNKISVTTYDDDSTIAVNSVKIKIWISLKDYPDESTFVEHLF